MLSAWVDSAWCYRRGWTVHDVIGVGGQCMVLSGVDGQLVVHVL